MPTFNWVYTYQPITSDILTQPSHKKSRKQYAIRLKRYPQLEPECFLDYASILIHLLFYLHLHECIKKEKENSLFSNYKSQSKDVCKTIEQLC